MKFATVTAVASVLIALLVGPTATAQQKPGDVATPGYNNKIPEVIMTPDTVETRIGTLKFFDGMPDATTVQKAYDNLDFLRGVEVFLNFIPATSIEGMRLGMAEVGATKSNQCVIFDELMDSNPLFLTGNTDTVYACVMLDLKRDGATVIEIPPKTGPGTVNDAFFRFVTDMGIPGPDKGKGGKYVILAPDYDGELNPPEGGMEAEMEVAGKMQKVLVSKSTSYTNWLILRGFLVDGKTDVAVNTFKGGLKVYPLSQAKTPPKMEFINGSDTAFNTIHANTFAFYEELAHVLDKEPVGLLEPELRGLAAAIGIQKGKKFEPDARMKKILTEAVAVGNATARAIWLKPRDKSAYFYENSGWYTGFVGGDYRWLIDDGKGGRYLDARTLFFYSATVNTPAMAAKMVGVGSQYAFNATDKEGAYLDGSKAYKLNIPKDAPAKDFWSVVVYDPQTRSELQTSQKFPSKNNKRDKLTVNKDGSVDLYFGPKPPEGKKSNWIETVPGKGWFVLLRLYGPLDPWFDKTWRPGEFELVNTNQVFSQQVETPYVHIPGTISQEAQALLRALPDPNLGPAFPDPDEIKKWKAAQQAAEARNLEMQKVLVDRLQPNVTKRDFGGVPVLDIKARGWEDNGKVLVYTHGGAYTFQSAASTLASSALVADRTGIRVIAVDYTLAPHSKWRQTIAQVITVFDELKKQGYAMADIAIYGDSAGGGMAAGVVLKMRDDGMGIPAAVVLWSPWADITETGDTYETLKLAEPMYIYEKHLKHSADAYADPKDQKNPYVSPVYGDYTKGFPPTLIQGGTKEIFLSNLIRLYQALDSDGQKVKLDLYEGMSHVFQAFMPDTPESKMALGKVDAFLKEHLGK